MRHKNSASYNHAHIEQKWQEYWRDHQTFAAANDSPKEKKYILVEFPYPSGEGLHMGHLRPYTAGDVMSRFWRMRGCEVLYPMGWDAFGLPAENYAIKKGVHPSISTEQNIKNAKKQLQSWGMSFDWSREVNTTDPAYYRWTQWIFLQFWHAGLAYEAVGLINWCPKDKTGLANEEVIDGRCERCGAKVEKKELRQWYLKITAYAEKLLTGLDQLRQWPDAVKLQQEHWIGKSEGSMIDFRIKNTTLTVSVFTTRPDTLYGVTALVLAPEHHIINELKTPIGNIREVRDYIEKARSASDTERLATTRKKTGVPLKGIMAIHPATKEEIPLWTADYVLAAYGTGAVMSVPAHDDRDFAFAKKYDLPMKIVIMPDDAHAILSRARQNIAYTGSGVMVASGPFTGMPSQEAKDAIVKHVKGKRVVQYKLRDWVFSRQRYWGEPIPLIHCSACGIVPVPEKDLPVTLPDVEKYEPTGTGESPLAAIEEWVNTSCPRCKGRARRETNTMPQWAGSCWYFLRYTDPHNAAAFADKEVMKQWLPVDIYFGGAEHITLHLLYSRFWNLFLYDQQLVPVKEPYTRRAIHGIILGPDGEKMSKSRGNVVNPNDLVSSYGADTVRMYELFLGPHEATVAWNDNGIIGIRRFIERVWRLYADCFIDDESASTPPSPMAIKSVHRAIKKVTDDINAMKFNTAISAMMMCVNELYDACSEKKHSLPKELQGAFVRILSPFAPHIAEELWRMMGHQGTLAYEPWPSYDEALIREAMFTLAVQINGKTRDTFACDVGTSEKKLISLARERPKVKKWIEGKNIKKTIYIKGRLINLII
ncbi:leucine--tRNA ligase [Candidatus Uhrbacteria bacterium]|nr:leucine--tRNA ligase [Candidatus Uhrbacteria bacterium]